MNQIKVVVVGIVVMSWFIKMKVVMSQVYRAVPNEGGWYLLIILQSVRFIHSVACMEYDSIVAIIAELSNR